MTFTLFPYARLRGAIELLVREVRLDGDPVRWATSTDEQVLELRNDDDDAWDVAEIDLEVHGPAVGLDEASADMKHVSTVAVINCNPTNYRRAVVMAPKPEEPGSWTATLELVRSEWFGQASLAAVVVASIDGIDERQAAVSRPWSVRFDDLPKREYQDSIPVVWETFAEPDEARIFLREFADNVSYLQIDVDGPVLFLNDSIRDLRALLEERPRRPAEQRALRSQILSDVATEAWHAMFVSSLDAFEATEEGMEPPAEAWKTNVVDALLPSLYPNLSLEEARLEAVRDRHDVAGSANLQERLIPAIAKHLNKTKTMRAALREIAADESEED